MGWHIGWKEVPLLLAGVCVIGVLVALFWAVLGLIAVSVVAMIPGGWTTALLAIGLGVVVWWLWEIRKAFRG